MSIIVNNLQSVGSSTLSYTPANVSDSVLVVIVSSEDINTDEPITAISFGATVMSGLIIGSGDNGTHSRDIAMAYLVNPGTSSETISVTGGESNRIGIVAVTLNDVDQSAPLDVSVANGFISGTALTSTAITSNDNSFILSGAMTGSNSDNLTVTGATKIVEFAPSSSKLAAGTSTQVTAGTYSHNWISSTTVAGAASASMAFNLASSGITITGATANYDYSAIDGTVELTALITVIGQTANYDYDGIVADIILQGSIVVTGSTANYDYNALNGTIIIQGPITINPKNIIRVKRKSNIIRAKTNSNIIRVKRNSNIIRVR